MTQRRTFGRPRNDSEVQDLSRILEQSFVSSSTPDSVESWLATAKPENIRVIREDERVLGCLIVIPMGIFLGGRSVPTAGIAGVGVDPAHRGRRVGHDLMRMACEEFRDAFPLSSLYASNYAIYRSVGYERSGAHFSASVALRDLPATQRDLDVRMMTPQDTEAVKELYRRCAQQQAGALDRGPYIWSRVDKPRGVERPYGWLVYEGEQLVGYARWHQPTSEMQGHGDSFYDLKVIDMAATNARAIQRIFTLFRDHSSIAGDLHWASGPDDPFLLSMSDRYFTVELAELWMVRVLDVEKALLARGYPSHFSGELSLHIEDEVLSANAGNYMLKVEAGKASVERGGEGLLHLDARALAPLFTGYLPPETLRTIGWIEGSAEQMDLANALFSGPTPWCRDMY